MTARATAAAPTKQVLQEMRTLVEVGALATTATVSRWLALLEEDAEDPVVHDARQQARKDV